MVNWLFCHVTRGHTSEILGETSLPFEATLSRHVSFRRETTNNTISNLAGSMVVCALWLAGSSGRRKPITAHELLHFLAGFLVVLCVYFRPIPLVFFYLMMIIIVLLFISVCFSVNLEFLICLKKVDKIYLKVFISKIKLGLVHCQTIIDFSFRSSREL